MSCGLAAVPSDRPQGALSLWKRARNPAVSPGQLPVCAFAFTKRRDSWVTAGPGASYL